MLAKRWSILMGLKRSKLSFLDVVMPGGRTGVQLTTEARRLRPELRVLLTSGYVGVTVHQVNGERRLSCAG